MIITGINGTDFTFDEPVNRDTLVTIMAADGGTVEIPASDVMQCARAIVEAQSVTV